MARWVVVFRLCSSERARKASRPVEIWTLIAYQRERGSGWPVWLGYTVV